TFGDVPNTNIFHADINALADSGVTTGCNVGGTLFCPIDFVTRQQMAAFMNRLGALAPGKTPVVNADALDGMDSTDLLADAVHPVTYRCNAWDMVPSENIAYFLSEGQFAVSSAAALGSALHLPAGASILGARWRVLDDSARAQWQVCGLSALDASGQETQILVTGAGTGVAPTPGVVTLSDGSVLAGWQTVDNGAYAYAAGCYATAAGVAAIWYEVDVEVSGLPLP
ncbi:MAG: hypothetical protein ACREF4_13805, partial [Gammaproteobacteria bacterium]